jgi:hypothetical protein
MESQVRNQSLNAILSGFLRTQNDSSQIWQVQGAESKR